MWRNLCCFSSNELGDLSTRDPVASLDTPRNSIAVIVIRKPIRTEPEPTLLATPEDRERWLKDIDIYPRFSFPIITTHRACLLSTSKWLRRKDWRKFELLAEKCANSADQTLLDEMVRGLSVPDSLHQLRVLIYSPHPRWRQAVERGLANTRDVARMLEGVCRMRAYWRPRHTEPEPDAARLLANEFLAEMCEAGLFSVGSRHGKIRDVLESPLAMAVGCNEPEVVRYVLNTCSLSRHEVREVYHHLAIIRQSYWCKTRDGRCLSRAVNPEIGKIVRKMLREELCKVHTLFDICLLHVTHMAGWGSEKSDRMREKMGLPEPLVRYLSFRHLRPLLTD